MLENVLKKKFLAFVIPALQPMIIIPAPSERSWPGLDATSPTNGCLAMTAANSAGWSVLNNQSIEVVWNGGKDPRDLKITPLRGITISNVSTHLGHGMLIWRLPFIFRPPTGLRLRVRGPANWPKDGATPLEGIVENDSDAISLSMVWKITRAGAPIRFEMGDPLCTIQLEVCGVLEQIEPEIHSLDEDPDLKAHFQTWSQNRLKFNNDLLTLANPERWQTHYFVSEPVSHLPTHAAHHLRSPEFKDVRSNLRHEHTTTVLSKSAAGTVQQTQDENCHHRGEPAPVAEAEREKHVLLVEDDFYEKAEVIRSQFEKQVTSTIPWEADNPLVYTFAERAYQFLSANVDNIFTRDSLLDFMDRLRAWSRQTLGVTHASSPRLRVYVKGCWRALLRDDASTQWHYLYCLTRNGSDRTGRLKLLSSSFSKTARNYALSAGRVINHEFRFNQLLLHDSAKAYAIDSVRSSMNPIDGLVVLDGHLW